MNKNIKSMTDLINKNRVKMETRIDNYYAEFEQGCQDSIAKDLSEYDVIDIIETTRDITKEQYGGYRKSFIDNGSGDNVYYNHRQNPIHLAIRVLGRLEAEHLASYKGNGKEKTSKVTGNDVLNMIRNRQNND